MVPAEVAASIGAPPSALADFGVRVGWLVIFGSLFAFAIYFNFLVVRELYGGDGEAKSRRKVNCPACGARTPAEADACGYCEEPLDP